ncbi:MAG: hypothetical protein CMK89_12050 [Pseudomonadales bacterium]|nr:hypothetical protein [Pseudomonadales bacterium]
MNSIPEIQYANAGDILLAYQVLGQGERTLLFVNGFVSHLECIWEEPKLNWFLTELARHYRVVLFDKRGVGLSERISSEQQIEDTLEDISTILSALSCDRVSLLGVSEGGPATVLFAATYPQKVDKLILYGTMPKWSRSFDYPWALSKNQYKLWLDQMIEQWGGPVSLDKFAPSQLDNSAFRHWWARALRMATSPGSLRTTLDAMQDIDVRPALSHVRAPTLILHRKLDQAVPFEGGRLMAQQIADSQLVALDGIDHWWWTENPEEILQSVHHFLLQSDSSDVLEQGNSLKAEALSKRELDVLKLAKLGYTNQQIAEELHLSTGTVKTYSSSIYGKLHAKNRTEAIAIARKMGLIT